MRYRGKDIEIIGEKQVFGKRTAWVRMVEDNSFQQVLWDDIDFEKDRHQDLSHVRYVALAARIKEEIAQKRKIETEQQQWLDNMRRSQSVVPDVKIIIKVRVDG